MATALACNYRLPSPFPQSVSVVIRCSIRENPWQGSFYTDSEAHTEARSSHSGCWSEPALPAFPRIYTDQQTINTDVTNGNCHSGLQIFRWRPQFPQSVSAFIRCSIRENPWPQAVVPIQSRTRTRSDWNRHVTPTAGGAAGRATPHHSRSPRSSDTHQAAPTQTRIRSA